MPLAAGARLGSYEITGQIGAGGMGEVYRARDPRLHRDVAIKVLSAARVVDPVAVERFFREARTVASLSHPAIVTIHDVGEEAGFYYLVTELLEGQPLRHRIDKGALPWPEALAAGAPSVMPWPPFTRAGSCTAT